MAAPGHVDDALTDQQRGIASLEDATRIGEIAISVVAQQRDSPQDCFAPAQNPRKDGP